MSASSANSKLKLKQARKLASRKSKEPQVTTSSFNLDDHGAVMADDEDDEDEDNDMHQQATVMN
ncbi:hypothetical protein E1B28_010969 [Marasmius oreades]|uniref:Uncharacterized protein n=1 Tax=Marasmius oreades TaxID=181124 RepID=A0A9P7RU62_9AGAR|nr:uncharacterized protein E1B28_010969 [Marasmius oreades]KAG7089271.1 hypothetical protein E1B28_010969 [Marasmius oreades]